MKNLFLVCLLVLPGYSLASDYSSVPDKFFSFIKSGESDKAIDYLYGTNRWVSATSDQVVNLKAQLSGLDKLVGNYLFHELILEEKVGSRYSHLIYLVGYERQPIRFEIKVYKNSSEWRFQGISFDTDLANDVAELANRKLVE